MAFLEHKSREGERAKAPWLAALGVSSLMSSFHREIFPWSPRQAGSNAGTPAWEISLPWGTLGQRKCPWTRSVLTAMFTEV